MNPSGECVDESRADIAAGVSDQAISSRRFDQQKLRQFASRPQLRQQARRSDPQSVCAALARGLDDVLEECVNIRHLMHRARLGQDIQTLWLYSETLNISVSFASLAVCAQRGS